VRIAIDIDSTLHHYWDLFREAAERRFGVDLPYDRQVDWHIAQLEPAQVRACIEDTHGESAILDAEPYPGAVDVVRRWHEAGHFIHVTSHRAQDAHGATARWLERIGLPHDELYCSYDKISRCREIGIDVLVDDSPVNLRGALEHGILPATIVHPWNRDVAASDGVVSAEDWPGLERALAPVLNG
jgi:hypothetical protein